MSEPRVQLALSIARNYGGTDGAHHKDWVIDQMVRCLTGCTTVRKSATDYQGIPYEYDALDESDEYKQFVANACAGEDGPDTYTWEAGIAP